MEGMLILIYKHFLLAWVCYNWSWQASVHLLVTLFLFLQHCTHTPLPHIHTDISLDWSAVPVDVEYHTWTRIVELYNKIWQVSQWSITEGTERLCVCVCVCVEVGTCCWFAVDGQTPTRHRFLAHAVTMAITAQLHMASAFLFPQTEQWHGKNTHCSSTLQKIKKNKWQFSTVSSKSEALWSNKGWTPFYSYNFCSFADMIR